MDTDVTAETDTVATIRLRTDRFDLMAKVLGMDDAQLAEELNVHRRTIARARQGLTTGEVFMAQCVEGFMKHEHLLSRYGLKPSLDELFEVVEPVAKAAA